MAKRTQTKKQPNHTVDQELLLKGARASMKQNGKALPPTANASDTDLLLAAVRESLEKYGTLTPPREALLAVEMRTCPHCDPKGEKPRPVMRDFGLRPDRHGRARPQSWCRDCRNGRDSHPTRWG